MLDWLEHRRRRGSVAGGDLDESPPKHFSEGGRPIKFWVFWVYSMYRCPATYSKIEPIRPHSLCQPNWITKSVTWLMVEPEHFFFQKLFALQMLLINSNISLSFFSFVLSSFCRSMRYLRDNLYQNIYFSHIKNKKAITHQFTINIGPEI